MCEHGYDSDLNSFTQSYGSREVDASLLHGLLSDFLPADDKRFIGTVESVQRELGTDDGFLLRYRTHAGEVGADGFAGEEGRFLICTGWLSEALAAIGRPDDARTALASLLAIRNGLGLLAEEYDPATGRQLGNFPRRSATSPTSARPPKSRPSKPAASPSRRERSRDDQNPTASGPEPLGHAALDAGQQPDPARPLRRDFTAIRVPADLARPALTALGPAPAPSSPTKPRGPGTSSCHPTPSSRTTGPTACGSCRKAGP